GRRGFAAADGDAFLRASLAAPVLQTPGQWPPGQVGPPAAPAAAAGAAVGVEMQQRDLTEGGKAAEGAAQGSAVAATAVGAGPQPQGVEAVGGGGVEGQVVAPVGRRRSSLLEEIAPLVQPFHPRYAAKALETAAQMGDREGVVVLDETSTWDRSGSAGGSKTIASATATASGAGKGRTAAETPPPAAALKPEHAVEEVEGGEAVHNMFNEWRGRGLLTGSGGLPGASWQPRAIVEEDESATSGSGSDSGEDDGDDDHAGAVEWRPETGVSLIDSHPLPSATAATVAPAAVPPSSAAAGVYSYRTPPMSQAFAGYEPSQLVPVFVGVNAVGVPQYNYVPAWQANAMAQQPQWPAASQPPHTQPSFQVGAGVGLEGPVGSGGALPPPPLTAAALAGTGTSSPLGGQPKEEKKEETPPPGWVSLGPGQRPGPIRATRTLGAASVAIRPYSRGRMPRAVSLEDMQRRRYPAASPSVDSTASPYVPPFDPLDEQVETLFPYPEQSPLMNSVQALPSHGGRGMFGNQDVEDRVRVMSLLQGDNMEAEYTTAQQVQQSFDYARESESLHSRWGRHWGE
ncbi:unnamed protein product, partial [Symbiodinium sp. KB8]